MNRTFKVVFNKARGALMVANEATSSVQKKGTKAVVAAAVTMAFSAGMLHAAPLPTKEIAEGWADTTYEITNKGEDYFGGKHSYGNTNVVVSNAVFSNNHLLATTEKLGEGAADAQGGVMYLYSHGGSQHDNTVYQFSNVRFENNSVLTESNQGNRPAAYGGALTIKGGTTTFTNTVFVGNTATAASNAENTTGNSSSGGGSAAGGAIFVDSTQNTYDYEATLNFEVTQNGLVNSGNTVSSGLEKPFTDGYTTKIPTAGGFLFMDRDVTANFNIAEGVTYTVGIKDAYKTDKNMDSIASSVYLESATHDNVVINKNGAGTFLMHGSLNDYYGTVNVNEGVMEVTSDWAIANAVTIQGGELKLNNATFTSVKEASGYAGSAGGSLEEVVDDAGSITVNGGQLTIANATLKEGAITISGGLVSIGDITTDGENNISMSSGTLDLTLEQVFGKDGSGDLNTSIDSAFNLTGGSLDFTDETVDQSWLSQVTASDVSILVGNVLDSEGNAVTEVTSDDLTNGVVYTDAQLKVEGESSELTLSVSNAGVQTVASTTALTKVSVNENFTLVGNGEQVFTNESADGVTVSVAAGKTLTLGTAQGTAGGVIQGTIEAGSASVNVAGGTFEVNGVAADSLVVGESAELRANKVTVSKGEINGMLVADELAAPVQSYSVFAFSPQGIKNTGFISARVIGVGIDTSGYLHLQQGAEVNAVQNVEIGGVVSTVVGTTSVEDKAVGYFNDTVTLGENGQINIGEPSSAANGQVTVGTDGVLTIDASAFSEEKAVVDGALTVEEVGSVVFENIGKAGSFLLATGTVTGLSGNVDTGNVFVTASVGEAQAEGTFVQASANTAVSDDTDFNTAAVQVINGYGNDHVRDVLAAIGDTTAGDTSFVEGGKLTATGVQAAKESLIAPVTAGTYNVAYDAANVISDKLIQRNLEVKNGLGVWADVFYASNETDTLYGASGYSADIYGGMLGVDMAFGEGARVGAALSIGTGDADSEGTVFKYSSDADFWGLSLYAGKDVGGLTFTADMSYLWLDNDISGSVNGASASESLDSTVFTIGARADWAAYAGDVMQVVPHVGIRWANIDVDDYRGMSMDSMNVIEMPIGVTVKGNFETASGWTVTPAFDFTVAPQIGDTEVETIVGDVDVIDNVYNATIGVSAGNDTMRFGLDYKYGFGNEGRSNNTFNLKASYLF